MRMLIKILIVPTISAVCLLLLAGLIHAEERYISDTIVVSLREGPGPQYNVIKTLQTGQSFEVLETRNGFIRVRIKDGSTGWLQDQFTSLQPSSGTRKPMAPDGDIASPAKKKEQPPATTVDSQPRKETTEPATIDESAEVKGLQAELAKMTKQFNELEYAAQNVLQIEAENDRLKKELATVQEGFAELKQTNAKLASREEIYWFLAGSGVFFLGMMLGRISFRRQRHHSSLTL